MDERSRPEAVTTPREPRRLWLAYPALLAVVPILNRQVQNHWPTARDAVAFGLVLGAAVSVCQLACYGALRAGLRASGRAPAAAAPWAAVLAAGVVALFYCWPSASDAAHASFTEHPGATAAGSVLLLALFAAAGWWLTWRGGGARVTRALPGVSRFLVTVALLLAGWSAVRMMIAPIQLAWIVRRSSHLRELAQPVPVHRPISGPARDVYVLLLDSYPSADVMREVFGIDNMPFLDSLRALGFRVPAEVRSNYPLTVFAVPSLLNFAQVEPLTRELPGGYKDFGLAEYLMEHNRAAAFLKARGYRTVFFPSVWFPPTQHNRQADVEAPRLSGGGPTVAIARAIWRSLLVQSFADGTLIRRATRRYLPTAQEVTMADIDQTFAGVAALATRPAGGPPVYAFAHLLIPHPSFMADSACRPWPRTAQLVSDIATDSAAVRTAFAAYVSCANRRVLATVRAILARPGPRPIVVLQGDHGTTRRGLIYAAVDSTTPAQIRERFHPFGAYYLPALPSGGAATMPDTVSLVNVLRTVFRTYHGADLPPVSDAMYLVDVTKSFRMTPIDPSTLRPQLRRR
ncbi:hypothetical protein tb265_08570 [Gemmatimonadetes bacterium T265]|nr:hypothetical protein tb265_08570 [Gemmatimonadetes bacterium T265]